MPTTDSLLTDILGELRLIKAALVQRPVSAAGSAKSDSVATDAELDDPRNNLSIRSDPKRWIGPSYAGCKYSECPPEYLDAVASFKDWQAGKDEESGAVDAKGRKKSMWARKDAKLARGWAQRLRNGWKAPEGEAPAEAPPGQEYGGGAGVDDDLPFLSCDFSPGTERWWR